MKNILYIFLLSSHALFAMQEDIKQKLQTMGINPAKITIDLTKIRHVQCNKQRSERISYWAEYENGSVGATLWCIEGLVNIESNISICALVNGVMHISEKNINPAHYYLLHILHRDQEMKEALQYMDKIALE